MNIPFSQARWIWSRDPGDARYAVRRFRGVFSLEQAARITFHVSADSRYVLYLDGALIGRGPARSDVRHYVYETYTADLAAGPHVFAAVVVAYSGAAAPVAEMHSEGAFVLEAQDAPGHVVCATGGAGQWKVAADEAITPTPITRRDGYYAIGMMEDVDGARLPHGWEQSNFDDSAWETPEGRLVPYLRERPGDLADPGGRWRLMPRDIPPLREEPRRFAEWPEGRAETIPPHSRREWILNAGEYANGFLNLQTQGGSGATVTMTYAEAKTTDGKKAIRTEGTDVVGIAEVYHPGGGTETYSPLHWRAFRFVKLTVETGDAPLTVQDFSYGMTGYPWDYAAAFTVEGGPAELPAVLETDFRTLQRCTGETFMDCPYYEQLQYAGDSRLQALVSYVTTGDTRLGARAVRQFDWSRLPEGLTQSRYPTRLEQVIPPFSLIWVLMVEDLFRYAPDENQTAIDCLPGCRSVLEWFGRLVTAEGVVGGSLPWWNFVDWIEGWDRGFVENVPLPEAQKLPSATINLQYLAALQAYVRLCDALGETRESEYWQAEADMLADAVLETFWDAKKSLLRERTDAAWGYTQHAQAWGVLTGVIPEKFWPTVCEALETDGALTQATYYHEFYVVEALAKAGRLETLWTRWLAPWRDALALGFSTWPEKPEPTRSDCHAWSAWPTYALLTHVLGVRPAAPGFEECEIIPCRVTGWDTVTGRIALPGGVLEVTVHWNETGPRIESEVIPA